MRTLAINRGGATTSDFDVELGHHRKIAISAIAADATKHGGKLRPGE